jgi:hypothetical protein
VLILERKYQAFWVFEEDASKKETKEAPRGKPVIPPHCYEGFVVINDRGINLKGRSMATGEAFKAFILFSKISKMEKVSPHLFETVQEKIPEPSLRIIYQEKGKNIGIRIQEKLVETEKEEDEI